MVRHQRSKPFGVASLPVVALVVDLGHLPVEFVIPHRCGEPSRVTEQSRPRVSESVNHDALHPGPMAVEVRAVGERVHQVALHVPGPEVLRVRLQKGQGGRDGAPVLCFQILDCSLMGAKNASKSGITVLGETARRRSNSAAARLIPWCGSPAWCTTASPLQVCLHPGAQSPEVGGCCSLLDAAGDRGADGHEGDVGS